MRRLLKRVVDVGNMALLLGYVAGMTFSVAASIVSGSTKPEEILVRVAELAPVVTVSSVLIAALGVAVQELIWLRRRSVGTRVRRGDRGETRSRALLRGAGLLLPARERERYVEEWLDHVEAAREAGEDVRRVVRSIVLRALPRLVVRTWMRRLGAVLARS